MRWLIPALFLMFPALARAEEGVTFNRPAEGLIMDEGDYSQPKLNRKACDSTEAIQISVKLSSPLTALQLVGTSPTLIAWWASSGTAACTTTDVIPDADILGVSDTLATDDTFFAGTGLLTVPDDLTGDSTTPTLTNGTIMSRDATICGTPGVEKASARLCIGLDLTSDKKIDAASTLVAQEPHGWVLFTYKTKPPPAPDLPTIKPFDSELEVHLNVPATTDTNYSSDDISTFRVVARPLPSDATLVDQAPAAWVSPTEVIGTLNATSVTVPAENGVTYQIAAYARDIVDNEGPASAVATGVPQSECDFAECYPGGVKPGCDAVGATPLACLLGLLGLARLRGSRREYAS